MTVQVAVIGAGVIGAAIAERLRADGFDVTLIDRGLPKEAASYGNAARIATEHIDPLTDPAMLRRLPGLLRSSGPLGLRLAALPGLADWLVRYLRCCNSTQFERASAALAQLCERSLPDWEVMAARAGLAHLIRRDGSCLIFEGERSRRKSEADLDRLRCHGVAVERLDSERVYAETGSLQPGLTGGLLYPDTAHTSDPHALVRGLVARFEAMGGRHLTGEVRSLTREGGGLRIETADWTLYAEQAVLAAGAWSAAVAQSCGDDLPLIAERGYHIELPYGAAQLHRPVISSERSVVLTPLRDAIRVTGMVELAKPELSPNWRRCRWLLHHARALLPGVGGRPRGRWVGSRPTLPDYLPAIGRDSRLPRLIWATGHQHLGLTLAATTAELVGEIVTERPPSVDLTPFAPNRFRTGSA